MRIPTYCLAALICFWPVGASANWQYTKWGMTEQQVKAASKGAAVETSAADSAEHSARDGSEVAILTTPYNTGSFEFTAFFCFSNGRLSSVELDLTGGNPHELIGAFRNKYGTPTNENTSDPIMRSWMWHTGSDSIDAIMIGEDLTVNYRPQHRSNETGL